MLSCFRLPLTNASVIDHTEKSGPSSSTLEDSRFKLDLQLSFVNKINADAQTSVQIQQQLTNNPGHALPPHCVNNALEAKRVKGFGKIKQSGRSAKFVKAESVKPSFNLQNCFPTRAARRITILVVSRRIRNMLKQGFVKELASRIKQIDNPLAIRAWNSTWLRQGASLAVTPDLRITAKRLHGFKC